ncbi:PAS domain S-box protein [Micromonospora mirobrigensis]|uniref:PAS domain S-box-containing protein n=1 Tax=Micromonospora mirobrigensis TaxID=262898 RepID=A0A1C5AA22_9ACTN|nr:PAS domain S-box protein [Micromonospora mirobrigensis]SCF42060.1 PAS domain S-box-containing protein [Micromonospora mirobrigensis]
MGVHRAARKALDVTVPPPGTTEPDKFRRRPPAGATARAARQRADRRFRTLVEASTAVVWTADPDGRITEPQPSWEAYTGQRWPAYAGDGWVEALHPQDRERIVTAWRAVLAEGGPLFEVEGRLWHAATGEHRHFALRGASLRDGSGQVTEWIGTIADTHDRVRAEAAARRTAAISRALLDGASIGVGLVDAELRYLMVNPALAEMNGVPAAEHLGRRPADVLPAYGEQAETLMRRALRDGPVLGVEFAVEADPAGPRHFVAGYFPVRIDDAPEAIGLGFTVVEVTERTRLLAALGEERVRFERLAATDVLAVFGGEEERITEANEAFLTMLGYSAQELAQGRLRWPQLTPPGWAEADERALAELRDTGRARSYDKEYLHADGRRVPVQIGVVALNRRPLRWLAYAADLSAERAAQAELRLFQALVERSGDFIAVADPRGRTVYVNPSGRQVVGLAGSGPVDHPGQRRAESRLVRRDTGELLDVDHQTFTVTGPGDDTAYVATVARDVSDRQRALRQAQGLAGLAGALSSAEQRAQIVRVIVETVPQVVEADAVRVAVAPPGSATAQVTDRTGTSALAIDADVPLARTVRDGVVSGSAEGVVLCLPLPHGDGGVFGALEVRWDRPVTDDQARRSLLDAVAGLCGQALHRGELSESARAVAAFAARLSVTRSTAEAVEVILSAAPAALGAALPGLAVLDDGRVRLWYDDVPDALSATFTDLRLDDPRPIARALRTGERIVLRDRAAFARAFPGLPDPVGAHGIVTTVAVPLFDASRRPVAALAFGWCREHPLRDGDLALLDTVADLCEQTLERVRLAAAEHNLVTRLAGRLRSPSIRLPESLEVATRYRPAMSGLHLGGDWYDLIELPGDRLAVVLGDVVGHRVEAAADMAQLRTVVNTLLRSGVSLAEVFPRVTELAGTRFLGTCLAMIVDPGAGAATVARVGHPYPVRVPAGGAPETVATGSSLPLGLVREPVPLTRVDFTPGDLLVVYTDGLVERRGRPYDAGVAALHGVLAPVAARPVEEIADALLAGLTGSEDDQALVVIRHAGAAQ